MNQHTIHHGCCLDVLELMPDNSVDSIVTDPPYGLSKEPDIAEVLRHWLAGDTYKHGSNGFMGKSWDSFVPGPEVWRECLRVLKPGGHLLCFAGTRTHDLMGVSIRLAGFEIRDMIAWVYGSGFPKSMDVSKAVQATVTTGKCSMSSQRKAAMGDQYVPSDSVGHTRSGTERAMNCKRATPPPITAEFCPEAVQWDGWGTALKPALEPITLARKPFPSTVAANVLEWGTGGINVDGCRIGTEAGDDIFAKNPHTVNKGSNEVYGAFSKDGTCQTFDPAKGRWPANLIHDGSEEVTGLFPQSKAGTQTQPLATGGIWKTEKGNAPAAAQYGDSGSAARFFKECKHEEIDLLFHRAKALLSAWNHDLASTADNISSLSNQHVGSALSDVATWASLGASRLSGVQGLSTHATPMQLRLLCETLITLILSFKNEHLPDLLRGALIQNGSLARIVGHQKQTGTTTITICLPTSDGFADPATFSITSGSMDRGEADSAARFRYCAKASRSERDAGCEDLNHSTPGEITGGRQEGSAGLDNPRADAGRTSGGKNVHPTVKPLALMRYLVRLITPPGGVVLDPFLGSGTTAVAALQEGFRVIGIERDEHSYKTAMHRVLAEYGIDPMFL